MRTSSASTRVIARCLLLGSWTAAVFSPVVVSSIAKRASVSESDHVAAAVVARAEDPDRLCNGEASYCSRQYSNVTFVGAHDSAFFGTKFDPFNDQDTSLTDQLKAGVRFAEVQVHQKSRFQNVLELCHTKCLLKDAGPLQDYLLDLRKWLDSNPSEVFTLILANDNDLPVEQFAKVFSAVGLDRYKFVPSTTPQPLAMADWPTLGEMIDKNQRLVTFMDYCADEAKVPHILDQLKYTFSTPYDGTDPDFAECTLYQPANAKPDGRMYIMNHFLDLDLLGIKIPDVLQNYRTNAISGPGSIGDQVALCTSIYGRQPNFILLDMFDRGEGHLAERLLNGLPIVLTEQASAHQNATDQTLAAKISDMMDHTHSATSSEPASSLPSPTTSK